MRKLLLVIAAVAALAGCTNAEKGAVVGGVGGAALGTLAGGNDARNAIVGGAIGAVAWHLDRRIAGQSRLLPLQGSVRPHLRRSLLSRCWRASGGRVANSAQNRKNVVVENNFLQRRTVPA